MQVFTVLNGVRPQQFKNRSAQNYLCCRVKNITFKTMQVDSKQKIFGNVKLVLPSLRQSKPNVAQGITTAKNLECHPAFSWLWLNGLWFNFLQFALHFLCNNSRVISRRAKLLHASLIFFWSADSARKSWGLSILAAQTQKD
jgi:hypothetical protein